MSNFDLMAYYKDLQKKHGISTSKNAMKSAVKKLEENIKKLDALTLKMRNKKKD